MADTLEPMEVGAPVAQRLSRGGNQQTISVAILGAHYVGKSTLFNLLTGFSQRTSLWPETTVGIRRGVHRRGDAVFEIADLPSVYTLTATSPDEQVARECLLQENPDVVVVVVNAVNLERTLYLVAEVLELTPRVVVAVNMMDVASKSGIRIEADVLQAALGVPVVATSASRGGGVSDLVEAIAQSASGNIVYAPKPPEVTPELGGLIHAVEDLLDGEVTGLVPRRWVALKLLEGDREITRIVQAAMPAERWQRLHFVLRENEDAVIAVASARYEWIERMVRAALVKPYHGAISWTERIDRVATHSRLGPALLLGLLALLFWLVYQIAGPVVEILDSSIHASSALLKSSLTGAPPLLVGLLADGVLGGVGTVLSLLPILVVFFLGMGILKNVGYMARAAFSADRFMHLMGLHGESLIPLALGFGCNVPAVFGSRMIDSSRARLLTVLLVPLVPCTGRMAVLVFLAGALFGRSAPLITWGLVALNLVLLGLSGILFDRFMLRAERPALIMELPLYHLPNWRAIAMETWQSVREFLVRAGTVILLVSVLVWLLAEMPTGNLQKSYLALAGKQLEPVGALMGLDWRMMVALLTSFVAKENALATMGVLIAGQQESSLAAALPQLLAPASALAYLVLQVTFVPCASTLSAIQQQTRSWRWAGFTLVYLLGLSLLAGTATYQLLRWLGWGV